MAIGVVFACADPEVEVPIEARGFRALLIGAASVTAPDTICLSVATTGGEMDPSATILRAVQSEFPAVVSNSACRSLSPEPPTIRLISARLTNDGSVEAIGETVAEHMRRHRCTMARGAATAECIYVTPEGPEDSLDVPPT